MNLGEWCGDEKWCTTVNQFKVKKCFQYFSLWYSTVEFSQKLLPISYYYKKLKCQMLDIIIFSMRKRMNY